MEMAEAFIFNAGWLFFVAWGLVLAAISVIAFGRDLLGAEPRQSGENKPLQINH
jgi:hypothetical protein